MKVARLVANTSPLSSAVLPMYCKPSLYMRESALLWFRMKSCLRIINLGTPVLPLVKVTKACSAGVMSSEISFDDTGTEADSLLGAEEFFRSSSSFTGMLLYDGRRYCKQKMVVLTVSI